VTASGKGNTGQARREAQRQRRLFTPRPRTRREQQGGKTALCSHISPSVAGAKAPSSPSAPLAVDRAEAALRAAVPLPGPRRVGFGAPPTSSAALTVTARA